MAKIIDNPLTKRYTPNSRFVSEVSSFGKYPTINPKYEEFGESITDKESYRLSLLGGIGAGSISSQPGCYMFQDGKYDPTKDISYILRPDLSQVQIDEYIHQMESALKYSDESLKEKIKSDIQKVTELETAKAKIQNSNPGNNAE